MKTKKKKALPKKPKTSKPRMKIKRKAPAKKKMAGKTVPKANTRRKKASRKKKPALSVIPPPNSILLGRVEDYFAKIGVCALTLLHPLEAGGHLHILGHTTNLEQSADSLQIDHLLIAQAKKGDSVGIKVTARVRRGDYVFLIP